MKIRCGDFFVFGDGSCMLIVSDREEMRTVHDDYIAWRRVSFHRGTLWLGEWIGRVDDECWALERHGAVKVEP